LHLEVAGQVLLGLDHTHVNILLVGCSDLLLLLLQNFNLLGDSQLFHCEKLSARGRMQQWGGGRAYSSAASAQTGYVDERCADDGHWGSMGRAGLVGPWRGLCVKRIHSLCLQG
jgi:hypothetical protein